MAVNRLTGFSAIIVPRRIARAARTKCPIRLLVVSSCGICYSAPNISLPWWELSPPSPSRRGTDAKFMTRSPYERPVTRSVSALLTGSSRQPLNGFIRVPHSHVELDGPLSEAGFVIPRQTFVPRCHGGNFPRRAAKDEERGPLRPSILTGTSLHPVDARALPPGYPTPQTCRRPMVLQRKSNAATVNLDRSSGDERAIADT